MHNGRKSNGDLTKDKYWSILAGITPPTQLLSVHCHAGMMYDDVVSRLGQVFIAHCFKLFSFNNAPILPNPYLM